MIDDEQFFAWLDGELDPAEAASVEAMVAADPALQRRAKAHRALAGRLQAAFEPIVREAVPGRLSEAASPRGSEVIDFAAAQHQRPSRPKSVGLQWAAMAATLAIGLVAGSMISGGGVSPIVQEDGRLVASGELEQALYTRLASAPSDEGTRIGLTYRDKGGNLCRSFAGAGAAGLACHQGRDWRIRGLFEAGEGQQSEFRMASGPDPRLAELIDATIAGEPFDAAAERQAIAALR